MRKLSGLQRDVLTLYRELLRTVQRKYSHDNEVKQKMIGVVRQEFRHEAKSIGKLDFKLIEHRLRHGYKQKKLIEMPGFDAANIIRKSH
eukprot:gene11989-13087_t